MTPTLTIGVIGHVNHGKTALVRALTGIETDRLKDEIARGMSITLGFAWRDYPDGGVDLIDAPGHEDFIRAMVTGVTGARAVLLVVSASEGFGRQSVEHLQIAALLGIRAGVVAVTKADLLPPGGEAVVRAAVAAALDRSFLADAPIVFCSAVSGVGLEALHQELQALLTGSASTDGPPGVFLPIDRVFTIPGAGTVVTGTLQGAPLQTGAAMVLEPSGHRVSIRQIQVHSRPVDIARPGGRVAVGLRGVGVGQVSAGDVLCAPDMFRASLQVDARITVLPDAARPLKHLDQIRVMWGARHDIASVRLLGDRLIAPGASGLAQLRFSAPVVAFAGQRAVLRRLSPVETLGGATVLDPEAPPSRGKPAPRTALLEATRAGNLDRIAAGLALRDGGILSVAEVARLWRRDAAHVRQGLVAAFEDLDAGRLVSEVAAASAEAGYLDLLVSAHARTPARSLVAVSPIRDALARTSSRDLVAYVERKLALAGAIRLDGGQVALPDYDPLAALSPQAVERLHQIEATLRDAGLAPSGLGDAQDADLLQFLIESGRAVSLRNHALRQTLTFHVDALQAAGQTLGTRFPPPAEFTTGEARAALATTRKFIVPVLEHLDSMGLTAREGDLRRVVKG